MLSDSQNLIPLFSPPGQSELKCHFRLRKLYQPRSESIDAFIERILREWNLEGKVAYMQLSNVFKDELVEYSVGFMYDEDAYRIVRDNVVFRMEAKGGAIVNVKPTVSEMFQRYLEKNPIVVADKETYIPDRLEERPASKRGSMI